jgi:hypothetical protein
MFSTRTLTVKPGRWQFSKERRNRGDIEPIAIAAVGRLTIDQASYSNISANRRGKPRYQNNRLPDVILAIAILILTFNV